MKAILLARVSSRDQEENYSTPAQVKTGVNYCETKGFVIDEIIELVESSTKNRKKYNQLMKKIHGYKEPIALVVDCVDRLQRRFNESIILDELVQKARLEIHFIREGLIIHQKSNSADKIRWDMGVMFARAYVLQLSDNVKRGNQQKLLSGEYTHQAPIGYLNTRDSNDRPTIIIDPEKAPIIKMIFENYAKGLDSMETTLKKVTAMGLFRTNGNTVSRIAGILANPFYCGEMVVNGEAYPHRYQTIVSREVFEQCNVRRVLNTKVKIKKNKEFVFRNVLTCKKCGHAICGDGPKKGGNIYYRCSNVWCENYKVNLNEKKILEPWLEILQNIIIPDEHIKIIVEDLKSMTQGKTEFKLGRLRVLNTEITKLENRKQKLYFDKLDEVISEDEYKKYSTQIKDRINEIRVEQQQFDVADDNFYLTAEKVLNYAKDALYVFLCSDISTQNKIVKSLSSNSTLDGSTVDLNLIKPYKLIEKNNQPLVWHTLSEDYRTLEWHKISFSYAF